MNEDLEKIFKEIGHEDIEITLENAGLPTDEATPADTTPENVDPVPVSHELQDWIGDALDSGNDIQDIKKALTAALIIAKQKDCSPEGTPDDPAKIAIWVDWNIEKAHTARQVVSGKMTLGERLAELTDRALGIATTGVKIAIEKYGPVALDEIGGWLEDIFPDATPAIEFVKRLGKTFLPKVADAVGKAIEWIRPKIIETVKTVGNWFQRAWCGVRQFFEGISSHELQ